MKYTPLILKKLQELSNTNPDYSFGDLLYTVLRERNIGNVEKTPHGWIRNISDDKFYTALEKALKEDKYE